MSDIRLAEQWLIDGYNLLHSLNSQNQPKNSISREQLFARVAEFASSKKTRTLIVLDGAGEEGELQTHRTAYLDVIYAQKVPADTCIERYLFEHRDLKQMTVVTDDRAITNIARGCGASVLSTSIFSEMMRESRSENAQAIQRNKARAHGFNRPFEDKLKDL